MHLVSLGAGAAAAEYAEANVHGAGVAVAEYAEANVSLGAGVAAAKYAEVDVCLGADAAAEYAEAKVSLGAGASATELAEASVFPVAEMKQEDGSEVAANHAADSSSPGEDAVGCHPDAAKDPIGFLEAALANRAITLPTKFMTSVLLSNRKKEVNLALSVLRQRGITSDQLLAKSKLEGYKKTQIRELLRKRLRG